MVPTDIAQAMAQAEHRLQQLAQQLAGSACAHCSLCCCHTDLCEEAERSPFLQAVRAAAASPTAPFCDRYGWLGHDGCRLSAGRPAACYHYWCPPLRAAIASCETGRLLAIASGSMVYLHQQPGGLLLSDLSASALDTVAWGPVRQRIDALRALDQGEHPDPVALEDELAALADAPL